MTKPTASKKTEPTTKTIGKYVFELKKVQHMESRSRETECFSAILCVNGKQVAECGNDGCGAENDVYFFPDYFELGREISNFLETQPKAKHMLDDEEFEFDVTIESIVDELLRGYMDEKFQKKLLKLTEKWLVFKESDTKYPQLGWKNTTIAQMLQRADGKKMIKEAIAEQVAMGLTLINENIPAELLPAAASTETQK